MSIRCLILTRYDSAAALGDRVAGRWLLWGLDQRSIAWEIHQPWHPRPDLESFDVVLCWSYRFHKNNYIFWARKMRDRCARLGVPVINDAERADAKHSFFLRTWRAHGLPCARCQRVRRPEDITLDYPLILRRDGIHMGHDVALVRDSGEARRVIEARLRDPRPADRGGAGRAVDLAIEFIDTRWPDGYYRKYRSFVVGGRVLPRQVSLSEVWLVNFGNAVAGDAAVAEDRRFIRDGEPRADLLRRAGELSGADVVAVDYARTSDGELVLWEANRHFLMLGDEDYGSPERFEEITGRNTEEREVNDRALGLAIADLVLRRAGRSVPS